MHMHAHFSVVWLNTKPAWLELVSRIHKTWQSDCLGRSHTQAIASRPRMAHAGASPHWKSMWANDLVKRQAFAVGDVRAILKVELARNLYARQPAMKALVPGCGRAYDDLALAKHGFDSVMVVDPAPTACESAKQWLEETGDPAAAKVEVPCADFFTSSLSGKIQDHRVTNKSKKS